MRIQALDRDWDINDITYKERREIYHLNVKAFWDGKVVPDLYYEVLEKCAEVSGLKEEDFKFITIGFIPTIFIMYVVYLLAYLFWWIPFVVAFLPLAYMIGMSLEPYVFVGILQLRNFFKKALDK